MKTIKLTLLFLLIYTSVFSQALSPERVKHIKECTVRISVENGGTGTGFIVGLNGMVITCWHVIGPSLIFDDNKRLIGSRKITINTNNDESIEYGISTDLLKFDAENAVIHDFCILFPLKHQNKVFPHLRVGNFNDINEGEEVYTCGYPFSTKHTFISKGILSTKYIDTIKHGNSTKIDLIEVALLDLTLNKGNSGGAIVKIGKTIDDDEVIGIADFIINPMLGDGEKIIEYLNSRSGVVSSYGMDPIKVLAGVTKILNDTSDGISGCVSINYYLDDLLVKKN